MPETASRGTGRIVFVNRFFYPDNAATSRMLSDLAFALAARGFDVEVVTSRLDYAGGDARYPAYEEVEGVKVHRVRTTAYGRANLFKRSLDYLTFYVSATAKAATRLAAGDTVVAKTDPPLMSVPLALVAWRRRARLVNWLQDIFPEIAQALGVRVVQGPVAGALKAARGVSVRAAAANVVLGESMAARLRALGAPPERIHVVPNWVDTERIQPVAHDDNPLRAAWDLSEAFVVMHSGNLGRAHDWRTILEAARRLQAHRDIRFVFVGGGHLYDRLQRSAADEGLDNLVFQPYQPSDRLTFSLSAADVHLSALAPALEGLLVPSKLYGIAAAGRPIVHIGGRESEIADLAGTAGWGAVVRQGDGAGLAETLLALRADQGRCVAMGEAGRRLAVSRFDRRFALERWVDVLSPATAGVRRAA